MCKNLGGKNQGGRGQETSGWWGGRMCPAHRCERSSLLGRRATLAGPTTSSHMSLCFLQSFCIFCGSNVGSVWLILIEEANNASRGDKKAAGGGRITGWGGLPFQCLFFSQMVASHASTTKLTVPFENISGVKSWKVLSLCSTGEGPSSESSQILFLLVFSCT